MLNSQGYLLSPLQFNIILEVVKALWLEKKKKLEITIGMEEVKLSLLIDKTVEPENPSKPIENYYKQENSAR